MNLSTPLIAIVFFVGLGGIVVAQQLDIRSQRYQAGVSDKELRKSEEDLRVLKLKLARERDPKRLFERARDMKAPLLAPDEKDPPPPKPEKPVVKKPEKSKVGSRK
ncbi:MAG: hypothetical protein IT462_11240 [Planctomycetes bacterium]|nr:hypothetical protein [Planctomycetota bacterium]